MASSASSARGAAAKKRRSTPLWMATGSATPSCEATSSAENWEGQMTTAARRAELAASVGG